MKVLAFYLAVFATVFTTTSVFADDITLEMLNKRDDGAKMVYSEDIARVNVGDTITWVPTSKGHNVEMIAGPEGVELPKKSKNNKIKKNLKKQLQKNKKLMMMFIPQRLI